MRFLLAFVFLAFSASSLRIQKETDVRLPPNGWVKGVRARPADEIALVFVLNPQKPASLEETLLRVSDPRSPDYGKHLTYEQAHQLAAPSIEARNAVRRFLREYNADVKLSAHPYDGMIQTVVSIATAEAMLGCEYYQFIHEHTQTSVIRTLGYSLPAEVADYIGTVGPTLTFPLFPHLKPYRIGANTPVDPAILRSMYNVGNTVGKSPLNQQVVTAFLGEYMSDNDLHMFWEEYYTPAEGQNIVEIGPQGSNPGLEADLDIEYITSMGGGVPTQFWYFNGTAPDNPENEPFLNMLYYLGNDTTPPWVVSTSYGEDENSVSYSYATSCNQQFQLNGARGISIIYSSGDSGVGSDTGNCNGGFAPQWPAASPYVTSVGATSGNPPNETAVYFSSGGFSNYWPQQPWQASAISAFFTTSTQLPPAKYYNASGRGFPDVAAQGLNFDIVCNGYNMTVSGTSCSAPTFSGIFSLLNDLRFQAGKSPLGFLNPWIYQTAVTTPGAFNDIITGNNPGCGTNGFYAIKGWDPVTGVGTPNYAILSQLVMSMP